MSAGPEALPDDIETLQAALVVARAEVAIVRAQQSDDQALIAHLKLQIEKLNRDRYGPRSERTARLLDQLELTLEELESSATEDELAAEMAAAKTTKVASFTRKRPSRKPFPEHLPRERVIVPGPTACSCCGGLRLSRLRPASFSLSGRGGFYLFRIGGKRPSDAMAADGAEEGRFFGIRSHSFFDAARVSPDTITDC